ncbi:MAG: hypothetical protein K5761_04685 [Clostridiales bacterium]|nr:hypothetical protein [Clostridiales bacterium]
MKILIVSNSAWRNENSFGNSFSNIFEGIEGLEIANIYCKYGTPQNNCVSRYFQITEKSLIKGLLKGSPKGREVYAENEEEKNDGEVTFNKIKKHKNIFMYWARGLIWKICRPVSKELTEFIDDYKPDLLFIPVYYSYYIHDINKYILKHCNIPALGYVSDDVYTLRQFSLSPFFWIDRILMRRKMARVFSWCKTVYVISDIQKKEYSEIFGDKFEVLTKCADFSDEKRPEKKEHKAPYKIVYAGNVSRGRYRILTVLADALERINADGEKFSLDIYTNTALTDGQKKKLDSYEFSSLFPPVGYEELKKIQADADILLHAEAFDLRERLSVHQSFSTKIVDYLASNRCILAIGDKSCSSIDYFLRNNCGAVADSKDRIEDALLDLYEHPEKMESFEDAAWKSGQEHHQRDKMQKDLYDNIVRTVEESKR